VQARGAKTWIRPIAALQVSPKLSDVQRWLFVFRFPETAVRNNWQPASSWHSQRAGLEQAKIQRTRRRRITNFGCNVMGTPMYPREHHLLNVDSGLAD